MKKLNMRKKLGIEGFPKGPLNYKKITDVLIIVKDLQQAGSLDPDEVEDLAGNLYSIFGDETLSDVILEANEDNTSNFIQIIGEYLAFISTEIELKPRGRELLESLIKVCRDPDNPKYQIKKVPLETLRGPGKEKEKFEGEETEVTEEVGKKKEIHPEKGDLSTKTIPVPYANLLNKYTEDEIWDIVSGKKTDVSEEEIEQAKEVISRGIVANRLSMRKTANGWEEYKKRQAEKLKIAGNPNTPPKALAELVNNSDWNIREALAGNPNTPLEIKENLRKEFTSLNMRKQAKEVISRGIVANRLSMRKTAQSTSETIQKAQQGNKDAIVKVIEENEGLIAQSLIKWGLTPGSDEFQDTLSDIKVEMLNRIIPQYDSSKGAFSTFLTTAVFNFLRRGTRKKEYEEKQKEVSTEEPTGEDITLGETLEDKSHPLVQMTISSARENLQNYLHTKNPELEDMILRIFDLKIEDNTHEQIAEALNKEGFRSKGKPITRFIVNNLVNEWIKPALAQFFEAFKTAKLGMKKKSRKEKMSEFTDRYKDLGIPYPDPETMCGGQCEGTGVVPVEKNDPDERFRKLWEEAEAKEPTDDGWHFVKCPDCNGTGKM